MVRNPGRSKEDILAQFTVNQKFEPPTVFQTKEPTVEQRLAKLEKTVARHDKTLKANK
jgi:hypothetical protein